MMWSMLPKLPRCALLTFLMLALAPLPFAQAQVQETQAAPAASALPASLFFAPRSLGGAVL
ncbi:MAG: hypothetical protein RSD99_11265, partial [Janthinobacterium sp.]